jgi:uncharacterized protein YbaP (TraB family)
MLGSIGFALAAALLAAEAPPLSAGQSAPAPNGSTTSCTGRNLLETLKTSDPARHARIVEAGNALENGNAIFWKLARPGKAPSYLYGTVHLSDRRVTRLSAAAKNAIHASKALLIENADLSAEAAARAYTAATASAVFSDGRSLEVLLSEHEFERMRKSVGDGLVPAETLRVYRPWIVSLMLSASDCERRRIQKGYRVLDMVIADRARVNGIPVSGLETTEQQLAALASLPDDDQIGMLRANIAMLDENESLRETMVQLYIGRQIGAIWGLQLALAERAGVPASAYASFQETVIVERNRKMRDAAFPHTEKGGAFIAVGALHLPGKTGLVELFREAGYTATPIE